MLDGMLVQDGCALLGDPVVISYNILCQCTSVCIKVFLQCMIFTVCTRDSVHNSTPGGSTMEEDPWDVTGYSEEIQEGLKAVTMSSSPSTLLMASDTPCQGYLCFGFLIFSVFSALSKRYMMSPYEVHGRGIYSP